MPLQGISNFCGTDNVPGLLIIEYAPTEWIDKALYRKLIGPVWNWQQAIPFSQGDWLTANALPSGRKWSEPYKRSKQGKTYDQVVDAIIPNLLPAVAEEFDQMAEYAFICKVELKDGRKWLVGTLDFPLRFRADGSAGETGSGKKGHRIRFEGPTIHKSKVYAPVF